MFNYENYFRQSYGIARNSRELASMVYRFFDKKTRLVKPLKCKISKKMAANDSKTYLSFE